MNRRKPLPRSTKPIKRHTRLQSSRTPIAKQRADPTRRRFATHRVKPFTDWLKLQPCCVTGKRTGQAVYDPAFRGSVYDGWRIVEVDPAHLIPRGRGSDDLYNCVPLARHLHNEQEKRTDQFNATYGVDLWALAKQYTEQWFATEDGQAWQDQHGEGASK